MREQNYGPAATSTSPRACDLPLLRKAVDEDNYTLGQPLGKVLEVLSRPDMQTKRSGRRKYYLADCPFCEERCVGSGYLCEDMPAPMRGHFVVERLRSRQLFYVCWTCGCLGLAGGRA